MEYDAEVGPTYKSLFLGACLIIGSAFGWWFTNFIASFYDYQKDIHDRLTRLENRVLTSEEADKYRDHKADGYEERLRRLERKP